MSDLLKRGEEVGKALLALSLTPEERKEAEALQAFPGGFEGCVAEMTRRGARDPRALCAFIGRRAGKIP